MYPQKCFFLFICEIVFPFKILKSPELNKRGFKISKKERGKFSSNFTNKHVISGLSHVASLKEHTRVRITQKTINQY